MTQRFSASQNGSLRCIPDCVAEMSLWSEQRVVAVAVEEAAK